ncbi:MAG: 2,3-bisphosphoglycerate-dependent phosphoglycerate mutase [Candidatus Neptunochlamydia sp.]|nr:2,3-bisphosphoglycerate-dependent phosphoglycerate mutase [Candidatus Neptunochlamydia sp.]
MGKQTKLILLRHGKSDWNQKNRFTGWVDVPLSKDGIIEAQKAGRTIRHIPVDVVFISSLMRAQMTAMIAMTEHESDKTPIISHQGEGKLEEWAKIYDRKAEEHTIPVYKSWEINERMYGELQGLDKNEARETLGADQVKIWRRSFDTAPPSGESLKMTAERSIPYFKNKIVPLLKERKNVLVSAHGNSLRSIVMYLDNLSKEEVLNLEIPTGVPLCYSFEGEQWNKEAL